MKDCRIWSLWTITPLTQTSRSRAFDGWLRPASSSRPQRPAAMPARKGPRPRDRTVEEKKGLSHLNARPQSVNRTPEGSASSAKKTYSPRRLRSSSIRMFSISTELNRKARDQEREVKGLKEDVTRLIKRMEEKPSTASLFDHPDFD